MKNEKCNDNNIFADVRAATVKSINTIDSIQTITQIKAGEQILSIFVKRFPKNQNIGILQRTLADKKKQFNIA